MWRHVKTLFLDAAAAAAASSAAVKIFTTAKAVVATWAAAEAAAPAPAAAAAALQLQQQHPRILISDPENNLDLDFQKMLKQVLFLKIFKIRLLGQELKLRLLKHEQCVYFQLSPRPRPQNLPS